jgi:hypothetical protein
MDPILLSDEEAMPQQTKRRDIAKKRNAGELLPSIFSEKKVADTPRQDNRCIRIQLVSFVVIWTTMNLIIKILMLRYRG